MEKLSENLLLQIFRSEKENEFFKNNEWIDRDRFLNICRLYGYPHNAITIVIENYYIDVAYRDMYYNYWSKFHFDWPRFCKRLFLFWNEHSTDDFFGNEKSEVLKGDFLGTIVVRPAYSKETDHTFGRTLLNPYKMFLTDTKGNKSHPFIYLTTTDYKVHLMGNTYTVQAFPFSSQDGVAMKCAETAIHVLCDYASNASSMYANVLPSDIQERLKQRLPERILPSQGLYCNDISYLLREFKFSPMIYAASDNTENIEENQDLRIGLICADDSVDDCDDIKLDAWDRNHITEFKEWFHYYVESAIPILAIISPNQEVNKHAILVVGHGRRRRTLDECRIFRLGDLPCMDTAELYESYIVQDDNQIPYVEEKMDRFTQLHNYKLDAFIVPLERHVFLEAASAVSICDSFINAQKERLKEAVEKISELLRNGIENNAQNKKDYLDLMDAMNVSEDNPITVRYYLANSAEYKQHRIFTTMEINEKKFYASILMPKLVWVAEVSTYKNYEMGYAFGEVVLDATASSKSKANSLILLRTAHMGVYRLPQESYSAFEQKIAKDCYDDGLSVMFIAFSNFKNRQ